MRHSEGSARETVFSSGAPRASERRGGGRGQGWGNLSRPARNALAYPSMGGRGRIRIRIRILAFTVNRVAKYMRNGATPEKWRKIDVFWRRTPRFCVGAVCARLVVRDAGWEQACVRSFARVFCVSQERWVVDGADRQQVRNTLNVHDSGLQAALSFTWRCIVGNGGSSSLSEDDSTRSRTKFQQAQSAAAQLANAWRKQQCFVGEKKLWESFFPSSLRDLGRILAQSRLNLGS